ncbi:hypothetical protein V1508DRAFT_458636 [Lipomyces doorenjongii]|uniref:uncharacterized protein n=1 Tax=Lipomyces doorenjongii TaxID=383834 RepID=UPI0034CD8ED3
MDKAIGGPVHSERQTNSLEELKRDFAAEPVHYFLIQWWENGQCERWAEMHIRNHPNFGISTTSRVEGRHGAIKRPEKMSRQDNDRAQRLSIEGSNEALFVRLEIRNQIETSKLCTAISRSGLELVYGKVLKKMQRQQEDGSWETCTCSAWHRYLLPCSHRIQLGVPISVTDIHPRWRVYPDFPPVNVSCTSEKGRPKGTRRFQTSAEIVQKTTDSIEKVGRCGSCKMPGHNRRKCPQLFKQRGEKEQDQVTLQQLGVTDEAEVQEDEETARHDDDYRD